MSLQSLTREWTPMSYGFLDASAKREIRRKMIKAIGRGARPAIEELVGTKVDLELWVKVWEKWRKRTGMLRQLGYAMQK